LIVGEGTVANDEGRAKIADDAAAHAKCAVGVQRAGGAGAADGFVAGERTVTDDRKCRYSSRAAIVDGAARANVDRREEARGSASGLVARESAGRNGEGIVVVDGAALGDAYDRNATSPGLVAGKRAADDGERTGVLNAATIALRHDGGED